MIPVTALTAATGLASLAVFVAALWRLGIVRAAGGALAIARGALAALRDPALDEAARERAARRAALGLFAAFCSLLGRSALALLAALLPLWLAETAGLAGAEAVLRYLARWDIILVASLVMLGGYRLRVLLWTPG